jgi:HAMP domain-containing protein
MQDSNKSIVNKTTTIMLVVALIAVGIISLIQFIGIASIRTTVLDLATKSLKEKTRVHLMRIVEDQSKLSESLLNDIKYVIIAQSDHIQDLYEQPSRYQYIPLKDHTSFVQQKGQPVPPTAPSDLQFSSIHGALVSFDYINIKVKPGITVTSDSNGTVLTSSPVINTDIRTFSPLTSSFKTAYNEHKDNMVWIYFGSANGVHFAYPGFGPFEEAFDNTQRGWYKLAVKTGDFVWTEPYVDVSTKNLMIAAAKPVYTQNNKLLGVVAADVSIETINKQIINLNIGEGGYSYLINKDGQVIAKPGLVAGTTKWNEVYKSENLLNTDNTQLNQVTKDMTEGKTGSTIINIAGEDKYIVYAPIKELGWSIAAVLPLNEALKDVQEIQSNIDKNMGAVILLIIIGILMVAVMIFFISNAFAKSLTYPILKLKDMAEKISQGNLDVEVTPIAQDEIGVLTRIFNQMTKDIKKYHESLETANKGLEKQVQQRTMELNEKVQELERMNNAMTGRELKMIEMKNKIEELEKKIGSN